jgi:hypothetical protein
VRASDEVSPSERFAALVWVSVMVKLLALVSVTLWALGLT